MDTDQPGRPGAKNFSVGYGNGLGPAPARPVDPASRPTAVTDLSVAGVPVEATYPLADPTSRTAAPDGARRRRGLVVVGVLAAGLLVVLASAGVLVTRRSNDIELGADHALGTGPADAPTGAEALAGNVITLDGEGTRGTIVLDDGSVMIVLDDGSLAEPNPADPDHPLPTTTTTTSATPPATDLAGHPVTTTGGPVAPTGPTTPTTSGVTTGPTASIPSPTLPPVTVAPSQPGVTVTVTAPPVTVTTPATVPPVTTPATLGDPPLSVPATFTTMPPIKLYPRITGFTGPKSAGCPTFYKGTRTITLSWTTSFASSATMSMDGKGAVTLAANGSVNLSFNCSSNAHTFTLRAVNSAGSSAPTDLTVDR